MSKTEERGKIYALHKASGKLHDYYGNAMLSVVQFDGYDIKNAYIDGCHQAEKDLELTWEDLATIEKLGNDFIKQNHTPMSDEEFYKEILKRFKERKEK